MVRRRWIPVSLGLLLASGAAVSLLRPFRPRAVPLSELVQASPATGVKIIVVGIDGACFGVMDPLLSASRLPRFQALRQGGASGVLRSEHPTLSPALWTTIATGRSRKDHGITHFRSRGTGTLVASSNRKTLALWNVASAFGRRVGFLGWWASWPAEAVNGWMVSDRATPERHVQGEEHFTHPAPLAGELRRFLVDPLDPPIETVNRLVVLDEAEKAEFKGATRPVFAHGLSVFKFAFCSQLSYERMALHLLGQEQPDLMGVFLVANDPVSHTFWHFYEPDAFEGVDRTKAARLGRLVPALYEHNDAYLGELLARAGPETVTIVVSDHGFEASGVLPKEKPAPDMFEGPAAQEAAMQGVIAVGQSGKHHLDGIFMAAGGPIRKGVRVQATIYDVAPTVLALLGLPVPDDMPGRVLEEAIEPDFLMRHPLRRIASYEGLIPRQVPSAAKAKPEDEEAQKDLLRSLGYIK